MTANSELLAEIKFDGTDKNGSLSPRDFIRQLEARKVKGNFTEEELIKYARACLRGPASCWFEQELPIEDTVFYKERILKEFSEFKEVFYEKYSIVEQKEDYVVQFGQLHHRQGESVRDFCGRVAGTCNTVWEKCPKVMAQRPIDSEMKELMPAEMTRAQMKLYAKKIGELEHDAHYNLLIYLMKKMVVNGIHPSLKQNAITADASQDNYRLFVKELTKASRTFEWAKNGNGNGKHGKIYEVCTKEDDTDDAEVAAASKEAKNKKKSNNKKGKKSGSDKTCGFCFLSGHATDKCFTRIRIEENKQKQKTKKVAATTDNTQAGTHEVSCVGVCCVGARATSHLN